MKKKKILLLLIMAILSVCFVFAGCGAVDYEKMYDDDTAITRNESYMVKRFSQKSSNGIYEYSCASLLGVYAIGSFTVEDNESATLSINVESGKFKTVLTDGKTVYTLAEGDYDGAIDFEEIPNGTYKLKLVGVKAKFTMTLKN